ncbi:MAG: MFS transporter [Gammaproteobacteria bacterium]|nr:MFS transporter [Gammaproteobacteria bacterium]
MSLASYVAFVTSNRRFVAFGFLMTFASSFGQTYFVGIFGPAVQAEFALSHTAWGTIYMIGTLGSAAVLPWSGKYIDRIDLRQYASVVCALIAFACLFMSQVSSAIMLAVAIFLLRQSGQGLMSHTAITCMGRYFHAHRGHAIAIATLGFATGEALLPIAAVIAITAVGWRWSYALVGILLAVGLLPTVLWLLVGHDERHRSHIARQSNKGIDATASERGWTRAEVLRDIRFYLILPGTTAPSLILTAMFFHHLNLADAKGWSHVWITGSYGIYAVATILTSLVSGPLIDRLGAVRLVPFMLVPLAAGMLVVSVFDHPLTAWTYLILVGINVGIAHTAVSAMWAEIYGVTNLGAIRSVSTSLSVFASALGPVTVGGLMDLGVSIERTCLLFAAYTVTGTVLMVIALARSPRSRSSDHIG